MYVADGVGAELYVQQLDTFPSDISYANHLNSIWQEKQLLCNRSKCAFGTSPAHTKRRASKMVSDQSFFQIPIRDKLLSGT